MSSQVRKYTGTFLCILGGLVAIGTGIFVTGSAEYLWALVLLMWGISRVRNSKKSLYTGAVMALLYIALGGVILFVKNAEYLWAMILINWLTDEIL